MLLAEDSVRPGRNMARKDTSFYKKGNQIAGSLLTGWEQCESRRRTFIPQSEQAVCCVHGAVGWLVRRPSHCSGWRDPHIVGGNISVRDCGGHTSIGPLLGSRAMEMPRRRVSTPTAACPEAGLNPLSAWTSLSQQIRPKKKNNTLPLLPLSKG